MKKMFWINICFFLFALFIFPLRSEPNKITDDTSFNDIRTRQVLRIGIGDSFPPIASRDPKTKDFQGLDIDIGRKLAVEFNVRVEFVPIPWKDKFIELNKGNIDCIMSGFSQVSERELQVIFSKPYLLNKQIILVKKKSGISSKTGLQDKKLGFMAGSSSEKWIDVSPFTTDNVQKISFINNKFAIDALKSGKIDALVIDEVMARTLDMRSLKIINQDFGEEAYAIGFRKNDISLRNEVNKFFDRNIDAVNSYIIKWLGADFHGLILSTASGKYDPSFEIVKSRGFLRIGIDDTFTPMTFRDKQTNELIGLDIDIAKTICERLGLKAEFIVMPWDEKDMMLNTNAIDCIMSGLSDIPERKNRMIMSREYLPNYHAVLVMAGSNLTGIKDLTGKKLGLKKESSSERWIRLDPYLKSTNKTEYQNTQLLLQALESGEIDAAIMDIWVGLNAMVAKPGLFALIANVGEEAYAMGFRMNDHALMKEINKVIDEMRVDGIINKAIKRWFGDILRGLKLSLYEFYLK